MKQLSESNYTSETMKDIFNMMEFTLEYLPQLKQTLYQKLEEIANVENRLKKLIEYSFLNYELYLINTLNENSIPPESEGKLADLISNKELQYTVLYFHYKEVMLHLKKGGYIEVDKKLLNDIFKFYRERTLYFKSSREEFKMIKSELQ